MEPLQGLNLNLGCGKSRIEGCVHIDVEPSCEPDLVLDFVSNPLPYDDSSVDRVFLFHVIEHIPEVRHYALLKEIRRVLKPEGTFWVSYPEFKVCALNYISNHRGQREFWKNTIYGLQRYPSDFHVALMDTDAFRNLLTEIGFQNIEARPEKNETYNTIVQCSKGEPMNSYEDLLVREVING
jgi:predicted SAM-dependent methyltransferase